MRGNQSWFVRDFLGRNRHTFVVPVYQRNYDWSKTQCKKLYEDILEAKERDRQHFMGYIAYAKKYNSEKDLYELLIIDGQQRIATMYILMKAMLDASIKGKPTFVKTEIEDIIFNRNCNEKEKMKLILNKEDDEQINFLFNNKVEKMNRDSNIYKNYVEFMKLINGSLSGGKDLGDIMEGIKKLEIFEAIFDTGEGDMPQEVFESINSTGVALTLSDLVKNFLLMEADRQEDLYEKYWLEVESNVGRSNVDDFIRLCINSFTISRIEKNGGYDRFKQIFREGGYISEEMLEKLKMLSKCYSVYIGKKSYYNSKIQDYLHGIYYIGQEKIMALVFKFFEDFEKEYIDEDSLTKVLEYTLTYAVRATVTGSIGSFNILMTTFYDWAINDNNYDNYYEKFVANFNTCNDSIKSKMPSDKNFRDALKYNPLFRKKPLKYLFTVLENKSKENFVFDSRDLEHIMPTKTSDEWRDEVGKDDYARVYETYLYSLGNLTHTGYNGFYKNIESKPFREKKKIIELNAPDSILSKDILSVDKWNEKAIEDRADNLADILINEIFPYIPTPEGVNAKKEEVQHHIDEIKTPSRFYPTKGLMFGKTLKVNGWGDAWEKFVESAYEVKNIELTNLIFKGEMSKYFAPEGLQNRLKSPKQIKESAIFFESKMTDTEIVDAMKIVIEKLKAETKNFNFYKNI